MPSVVSAIRNTVPITQFNRGLAGQIFEDVKAHGAKVVMKNNAAVCVLSPRTSMSVSWTSSMTRVWPRLP